ncbi:MAG: type I-E CRISPR-associated protein Cas5/CasD [Polyangiales bacterium]
MSTTDSTVLRAIAVRLEGPMQSYGASSVGVNRPTEDAPTKSALVGLLGAALGIDRIDVRALVELDRAMATVVRVDCAGRIETDYHTAQDVPTMEGGGAKVALTRRSYLADAVFTVLLCNESEEVLAEWHDALRYPRWAPVLGRRACPPAVAMVEREFAMIEGATWSELLAKVPIASEVALRAARPTDTQASAFTVYVDERLCSDEERERGRTLVRRDRIVGPGQRMFFDRAACVLEWSAPDAARHEQARRSDGEWPAGNDTTEWL